MCGARGYRDCDGGDSETKDGCNLEALHLDLWNKSEFSVSFRCRK